MIAAYIRVSTKDQKTDLQKAEIDAWAKAQAIDPEKLTWFKDTESGKNTKRPAFKELERAINTGKAKTVVVWKLDRLFRNKREGEVTLARWLDRGIRVVSVTQQIDIQGVIGEIIVSVLMGLGQIERDYILERQAAGIALAKKRGVYKGSKAGWTKARPARAKDLKKQGLNNTEISNALGVSVSSVKRYLKA